RISDEYPLSSAQSRLFFLQQLDLHSISYNEPVIFRVSGNLNINKVEQVLEKLVERHEMLRTCFELKGDQPVQIVHNAVVVKTNYKELINEQVDINKIIEGCIKPFDLSIAPLFRMHIFRVSIDQYYMFYDLHHIIADGVSSETIMRDFIKFYNEEDLVPLNYTYKDFAAWQNQYLESEEVKKQEYYWLNVYKNTKPLINLPVDHPRPEKFTYEGDFHEFELISEMHSEFNQFKKDSGITSFMMHMSVFSILLHKYTEQNELVIGSTFFGRPQEEFQNIMGIFVNELALLMY
ncbi:MAG: hypothetical protein GY756_22785, partial [bacterium]|nr:hypothetical protein [bacterium]